MKDGCILDGVRGKAGGEGGEGVVVGNREGCHQILEGELKLDFIRIDRHWVTSWQGLFGDYSIPANGCPATHLPWQSTFRRLERRKYRTGYLYSISVPCCMHAQSRHFFLGYFVLNSLVTRK
jgi:hypothetical protein